MITRVNFSEITLYDFSNFTQKQSLSEWRFSGKSRKSYIVIIFVILFSEALTEKFNFLKNDIRDLKFILPMKGLSPLLTTPDHRVNK